MNIKEKYKLTKEGEKSLKKGITFNVLSSSIKMFPIGFITLFLKSMYEILSSNQGVNNYKMTSYVIGIIISFVLLFVVSYMEYKYNYINVYEESAKRRLAISEHLRKLPISFFNHHDLADLTSTIMNDINSFENTLSHALPVYYGSLIFTGIIAVILFMNNWKMALALFWVIPISFIMVYLSMKSQKKLGKTSVEKKRELSNSIQENLEMMKEIRLFGLQDKYAKIIYEKLNDVELSRKKTETLSATMLATAQVFLKLGFATVIIYGSKLLINTEINLFEYILFLFTSSVVYDPLIAAMDNLTAINNANILVERLDNIYKEKIFDGEKINIDEFDLEFNKVSFAYEEKRIINNVSFSINKGEKVALVGPSGCGKSTLLKLVARFYDPDEGKITLGGKDISTIDSEELLKYYSIVFQNTILFDNSIMENIRIGNKNATDNEVIEAAKLANCHEFIMKLPKGYQTKIGENGKLLSGGEKQRISIARAFLKDAPIILLDEVTSAVDIENETLVQDAISKVTKGKTVLIIAHKLKTIENCNKIVVLNNGEVVEMGTHKDLVKKPGLYKKLYEIQNYIMS